MYLLGLALLYISTLLYLNSIIRLYREETERCSAVSDLLLSLNLLYLLHHLLAVHRLVGEQAAYLAWYQQQDRSRQCCAEGSPHLWKKMQRTTTHSTRTNRMRKTS